MSAIPNGRWKRHGPRLHFLTGQLCCGVTVTVSGEVLVSDMSMPIVWPLLISLEFSDMARTRPDSASFSDRGPWWNVPESRAIAPTETAAAAAMPTSMKRRDCLMPALPALTLGICARQVQGMLQAMPPRLQGQGLPREIPVRA